MKTQFWTAVAKTHAGDLFYNVSTEIDTEENTVRIEVVFVDQRIPEREYKGIRGYEHTERTHKLVFKRRHSDPGCDVLDPDWFVEDVVAALARVPRAAVTSAEVDSIHHPDPRIPF